MIGIDTNVLIRFLVQDDPVQAAQASGLFASLTEAEPGFLSREVMVEMVWVLERAYRLARKDIADAVDGLLAAHEIIVESADRVGLANERYRLGGAGFSDHLIALTSREAGCDRIYSFDRKAISSAGMTALVAQA
ncbi:type II toxin-antitoxin system VapC family toxin [Paracoccus sp. MBLB3053]|uniref:Type II toxin-antitoxin system VapC family toxin n=1 Tax=Paracoccus aurantius TaxID=3073814 RepID=A0ABU2HZ49_9RHOB|nr:type II toxin-antitoxin system VapC family toxin [Paracoccus sp. MBLB3053]MDS9469869.1 type II toxin-antitoxin system VapC family toxin [Paracoccus sp. MBLB3053]